MEVLQKYGALGDLVPFVEFKKREKNPWRSVTFSKVATSLKVTFLHGYFSCFLNCAHGIKSRKAPQMWEKNVLLPPHFPGNDIETVAESINYILESLKLNLGQGSFR